MRLPRQHSAQASNTWNSSIFPNSSAERGSAQNIVLSERMSDEATKSAEISVNEYIMANDGAIPEPVSTKAQDNALTGKQEHCMDPSLLNGSRSTNLAQISKENSSLSRWHSKSTSSALRQLFRDSARRSVLNMARSRPSIQTFPYCDISSCTMCENFHFWIGQKKKSSGKISYKL